jgi:hypothetical protein
MWNCDLQHRRVYLMFANIGRYVAILGVVVSMCRSVLEEDALVDGAIRASNCSTPHVRRVWGAWRRGDETGGWFVRVWVSI